jgi:hypothetical protein
MLWTIAIILVLLWALGLVTTYTLGGYIHVLVVGAVLLLLIRIAKGRRPRIRGRRT